MKAISILQPWASLVVTGHKKIETRSWNTNFRGELLIHASVGKQYKKLSHEDPLYTYYHPLFAQNKIEPIDNLPFGAIIGKVTLVDVVTTEELHYSQSIGDGCGTDWCIHEEFGGGQELAFGDYSPNRYGWLLSNPILFKEPIPCKGQLSIWNVPCDLKSKILAQI